MKKFIHERLAGRALAAEILRKLPQLEDKDALVTIICLLDGKMVIYTPAPGNALLSFKYDHQELLDDIEKVFSVAPKPVGGWKQLETTPLATRPEDTSTFHFFHRLPIKLRHMIWELVIAKGRVVSVIK